MSTVAINVLEPPAFNPESQYFKPLFNKISWLCGQQPGGDEASNEGTTLEITLLSLLHLGFPTPCLWDTLYNWLCDESLFTHPYVCLVIVKVTLASFVKQLVIWSLKNSKEKTKRQLLMKVPSQLHLQLCLQFWIGSLHMAILWGSTTKRNSGSASGLVLEKKFRFWFWKSDWLLDNPNNLLPVNPWFQTFFPQKGYLPKLHFQNPVQVWFWFLNQIQFETGFQFSFY